MCVCCVCLCVCLTVCMCAPQELGGVLAQEVKHEETVYEQDELVAKGVV